MSDHLTVLPVEVIESIVSSLDFDDICNLRLSGRHAATKSSQGQFKTYFKNKTIFLTKRDQMENFVSVTQQSDGMGCLLQHLIVVDIARSQISASRDPTTQKSEALLGQALKNLRINASAFNKLSLQVRGETKDGITVLAQDVQNWAQVWDTAGRLFHSTARALQLSALPVGEFDIFTAFNQCSLACDLIALDDIDLSASLRGLKRLSLSLSNHKFHKSENKSRQAATTGQKHNADVCRFLNLCPQLEEFELHWYNLYAVNSLSQALMEERRIFDRISQSDPIPMTGLKRLKLTNLCTTETDLLTFLSHKSLHSVNMQEIDLETGEFRPVFQRLVKHHPLEYLHLKNLRESKVVCFVVPGELYQTHTIGMTGPRTITRRGSDARKPIEYELPQGRTLAAPPRLGSKRERELLYGPPS